MVLRRKQVEHYEFLLKRLLKYGASSSSDLKTIVFRLSVNDLFSGPPASQPAFR